MMNKEAEPNSTKLVPKMVSSLFAKLTRIRAMASLALRKEKFVTADTVDEVVEKALEKFADIGVFEYLDETGKQDFKKTLLQYTNSAPCTLNKGPITLVFKKDDGRFSISLRLNQWL